MKDVNQLFINKPSKDFVEKIIKYIILDGFDENFFFTKKEIEEKNIIELMSDDLEILKEYYLPCKRKIYFNDNITPKRLITILRQILKLYNYKINSKEKYSNGVKFLLYNLEYIDEIKEKKINFIVDFD